MMCTNRRGAVEIRKTAAASLLYGEKTGSGL